MDGEGEVLGDLAFELPPATQILSRLERVGAGRLDERGETRGLRLRHIHRNRQGNVAVAVAEVVARWIPTLAGGLTGAAMRGLIRTAHAVRALDGHETPERVEELSRALAYWAARYQALPATGSGQGLLPSRAVRSVASARGRVDGRLINREASTQDRQDVVNGQAQGALCARAFQQLVTS